MEIDAGTIVRFLTKLETPGIDECWEWQGGIDSCGYGVFRIGDRSIHAHRVMAEIAGYSIDGQLVCHGCDNRKCCNPIHLFVGSALDNARDMVSKGRQRNGVHSRGGKDAGPWKRIPDEAVPTIFERFKNGEKQSELAREYGVSHGAINAIVHGRRRTHLL